MNTKIKLTLLALFVGLAMQAQMNALKVHPLHLMRTKIQYERIINNRFSVGVVGSVFNVMYSGYRIEPYVRWSPLKKASTFEGGYIQLKTHYTAANDRTQYREILNEYGYSITLGYQFVVSDLMVIDFYGGGRTSRFQYFSTSESANSFKTLYCLGFETGVSVGFQF